MNVVKHRSLSALKLLSGVLIIGCGDQGQDPAHQPELGKTMGALTWPNICQILSELKAQLGGLTVGPVDVDWDCSDGNLDDGNGIHTNRAITHNRSFHGAGPRNGTVADLYIAPYVENSAYFCAIRDSGGVTTRAVTGGFGVESRFDITSIDNTRPRVIGRRASSIVLFGAKAPLSVQSIDFDFRKEISSNGSLWGGYMDVKSSGTQWFVDAEATFPIGPVMVTLRPRLQSKSPSRSRSNNVISFDVHTLDNTLHQDFVITSQTWRDCLNDPFCATGHVPKPAVLADRNTPCPAKPLWDLTDGALPYPRALGGAACSSHPNPFIFVDPYRDWVQFGRTGGGPFALAFKEPVANLLGDKHGNATYWSSLFVKAVFNAGPIPIDIQSTVSMTARDGFAVRQHDLVDPDMRRHVAVATDLNSAARADLDMKVKVTLPFFGDVERSFHVGLGDTGNQTWTKGNVSGANIGRQAIAEIQYDPGATTQFTKYDVLNVAQSTSPEAARAQCLFTPPPTPAPPSVDPNPATFLRDVAAGAIDAIHPCNVRVCDADGAIPTEYTWDKVNRVLRKKLRNPNEPPPERCGSQSVCEAFVMQICNNDPNALPLGTFTKLLDPQPVACRR